ncbi:adenosylcobinamide-GDP ribazoletransferase [Castellaniella denitrificans]|uniref:adenosylcobinamide-GDP ribazoletransferase n=1 Tax=Castellaniella denitrificans TaxID=56119 RepID=UPI001AD027CD|nr:adenosylcobinamide-GDP ribazoletransferase [Burkholderiales bacterium]
MRPRHELRLFFTALQFFTRLPVPAWVGFRPAWLQHCTRYYPLVGWVAGGVAALAFWLGQALWPQPVAVLLSMAAGLVLTGAFHEDGFADVCDGLGGAVSRERALDIMKDSRLGTYGVVGLGLMLALKFAVLNALPPAWVAAALLLAHPASRLGSALLIWRMRYAREEGKAKPLGRRMRDGEFMTAAACGLLPALVMAVTGVLPAAGVGWAMAGGLAGAAWMARVLKRRLGGYTGDGLGAAQQLSELGCYLGLLALVA